MENIQIAILNDSFITNRGLQMVFNRIKGINLSIICTQWEELKRALPEYDIDIILVNNRLFNINPDISKAYKTTSNIRWALLKIENIDINSMYNFEFTISIYDKEDDLILKLNNFVESRTNLHNISSSTFELSEREKEILRQVALGLTNSEIADKLFISQHTVIAHRKNITSKLGIKTISGLTVYALLNDLISMNDIDELK
jgi:DNA-binding CsgD family transcriptional regulator